MKDKYYYLISQSPFLMFNQEPPMSLIHFTAEAQKWLSQKDYEDLEEANINKFIEPNQVSSILLKTYQHFEYNLRQELMAWRQAKKEGQDHKTNIFPSSLIKDISPLEAEINLLKFRWNYINELETGHHFDIDAVIAYFFKLQILDRLFLFNKEAGRQKFLELSGISHENNFNEVK